MFDFNRLTKEQISLLSTLANALVGLAKALLGFATRSSALIAEGVHSVIDFVSSGIVWLGIKVAQREPSDRHPYGWGRAEVLSSLVVVVFMIFAGLGIVREAVRNLMSGVFEAEITNLSLLVMVISVGVNEFMAQTKIRVGEKEESIALIADGKHSRVDVYSSGAALLGLVLARFFPVADSLTALVVGVYILYETLVLGREVGENLLDVADLEVEKQIREFCREEQIKLSSLRSRKIGPVTSAELVIKIPDEVKVGRVDDLVDDLQCKLIDQISCLEYVVVQVEGSGKRSRMLRDRCPEKLEWVGPPKQGRRVIIPYREGEEYEDFGAPEYLVIDYKKGNEVQRELIKNPFFKIGRGHGVRFSQAVRADEIRVSDIGDNAREKLKKLGVEVEVTS